jgi:myxalamid-type polyketide synthase MxaC
VNSPVEPRTAISAIKLALMAKQIRSQSETILRADPIAIIGMACRVPGGDTSEQLWTQLCKGSNAIREIPADRWDANEWYDPDLSASAKSTTRWGGFLERIDAFDADYFGILPREAQRMDPQQRLLLEVAIEAIDDAGLPHERLRGSRTGVYIASYHNDYAQLQHSDVEAIDLRTLTGTLHSVLANRLSYFLDLRSPSMSIDTACSSSLVAIHMACQSLRFGETNLAIAGGVSLIIAPELMVSMSKIGFMSPVGLCKTFDAQADGFVRGEGCGIVLLKRLSDAIADRDRVLAVIRGSAVNQDGRSTVLAAPNGLAQEALIRESLASAQLEGSRIGFFEAHGTGTALGDPIEVEAIVNTVGRNQGSTPCLLGSVKANLGHLEAAAGVTGLIKAVLALRHEAVPAQINFSKLNPHISLADTRLSVPTALTPWPSGPVPRCAAVSSFGVGGTNANLIVEEAPMMPPVEVGVGADASRVLTLSAQSAAALQVLAKDWIAFLEKTPATVADLCHTASVRRTHYDHHRIAVVGRSKAELKGRLQEYLDQNLSLAASAGSSTTEPPGVCFVFSGQGPQWFAMGRELMAEETIFRQVVERCDTLLRPLSGWSLLQELNQPEESSRLDQTEVAQPALFALQVALAELWKSWGVSPAAVIGHSLGEISALHVAGVLDLPEAIRIVWHRGRIMQQATGLGRMASVNLSEKAARELVSHHGNALNVGAINAPCSVVLSGDASALEEVLATLTARGVNHRMLPVQYAFHSAQMAPFQNELVKQLGVVRTASPTTAVYSTVTGRKEDAQFDSKYFGRNIREPVRFADAVRSMFKAGYGAVIEIGPQPVLATSIAECAAAEFSANIERAPIVLASLRRARPERETILRACAGAYIAGCNLVWERVQPSVGQIVELPAYPWQRKRHWIRQSPTHHTTRDQSSRRPIELTGIESEASDGALYGVAWQRASVSRPNKSHGVEGSWLLFADRAGTADALAASIQAAGGTCCRVLAGDAFERTSERSWVINPAEPEHFSRLLAQGGWKDGNALNGIVHCWTLDAAPMEAGASSENRLLGSGSTLHLVQALATTMAITNVPLWLVTRGAQVVTGFEQADGLCPGAAGLWGFANVVAIEQAGLTTRVVDLDLRGGKDSDSRTLLAELVTNQDARIALRDGERWAPRLQPYRQADRVEPWQCTAAATYWITGGLGALGCETARWLVRRGAKHLVLTGRRPPSASVASSIQELEKLGAKILVFQADAADRHRMQFVYDQIQNDMPPLRGVVHAAGTTRDAVLLNQRWEDAREIYGGKVEGAWLLHELTRELPLEFFILYSAAGVVLGAAGQGLYSAANAELDGLAYFRRRLGLPALSIAWGPWKGAGMAADLAARGRDVWQARGLNQIEPDFAFAQLENLLADQATYAALIPIDWTRFFVGLPPHADRDFFTAVDPSHEIPVASARSTQDGIIERLKGLPAGQRRAALVGHLTERALHALGLDEATSIELRRPLKEFGLDSLMAVELRNSLARSGGQSLPATLLFDYPTLDSLATYLVRTWQLEDETHDAKEVDAADPSVSKIAELSEQDAEKLLLRELEPNFAERRT